MIRNIAKDKIARNAALALTPCLLLGLAACEVEKTEDGEMPSVDVDVDGGNLPKYDIDGPEVDVKMKEVKVKVPDIDVTPPDEDNDG